MLWDERGQCQRRPRSGERVPPWGPYGKEDVHHGCAFATVMVRFQCDSVQVAEKGMKTLNPGTIETAVC